MKKKPITSVEAQHSSPRIHLKTQVSHLFDATIFDDFLSALTQKKMCLPSITEKKSFYYCTIFQSFLVHLSLLGW